MGQEGLEGSWAQNQNRPSFYASQHHLSLPEAGPRSVNKAAKGTANCSTLLLPHRKVFEDRDSERDSKRDSELLHTLNTPL
eukprot:894074-Pelagomonas_calceolata.AAC.5